MVDHNRTAPDSARAACGDVLTELLRAKAREMLAQAVQAEAEEWLSARQHLCDPAGHRQVVRNGYLPEREVITGLGPIPIRQPRLRDKRPAEGRETFVSRILPPYLRRAKSVDELIPWLYLRGLSTGDYQEALQVLLGADCPNLSANVVTRLKNVWLQEYQAWSERDLSGLRIVYLWADGVYFNVRLGEQDRQCILVVMGADAEGHKHLLGLTDGHRESEQSWRMLLLDLTRRGLNEAPKLATADGGLGFWAALPKVWGSTRSQRCWVHKTVNVLNYLPQKLQNQAKKQLHRIWMAPTREDGEEAFDAFVADYQAKYPQAAACLEKDRVELLCFYDFPAEHWIHIRTSNPIESTFATVRLRTSKTKGCGSPQATLAMVFKLAQGAEKSWRKLNGVERLAEMLAGVKFVNGLKLAA